MRVVYFGTYSTAEGYPRNRVLIEGLRRAGVTVEECHVELWRDAADKIAGTSGAAGLLRTAIRYGKAWILLVARYLRAGPHDVVVVGYTGQVDVFLAKALASLRGRRVVLDAFLSVYDSAVRDRGIVGEGSPTARLLRWLDRTSCRLADLVLLDTREHARFLARLTGLPERRFARLFVGEDDRLFSPPPNGHPPAGTELRVLWFGTWVPLQGADVVLEAAERLGDAPVRIRMIGRGQRLEDFRSRAEALANVELVGEWMAPERLVEEIRAADVCLGIFGTTGKALRVIPCKVYDAMAVGRPIVTSDTPAARELLEDGRDAVLVPPGDPAALADALRRLAGDEAARRRLGEGARARFGERAAPEVLGREFRRLLEGLSGTGEAAPCGVHAS